MSRLVRHLSEPVAPITATTKGEVVYEMFGDDEDLLALPVVDGERPIGLIPRDAFFLKMADRHGRALFAKRPVTFVMDKDPLIVEEMTPVNDLNRLIVTKRPGALMDGFVITRNGAYRGIGTGLALFTAVSDESEERNRKLAALAKQLGQSRLEALSAAKVKSDFLATMSHEIRTPLNGVLGISQLLLETGLNPDQEKLAKTIVDSGEILLRILNDVLDFSKLEAGKLDIEPESFALSKLADEARALWSVRAAEKALDFTVTCDGKEDQLIFGDRVRLEQVLFNLIGNAIKFTEQGSVSVVLSTSALGGGCRLLRADVRDTGCGIPLNAQSRMFQQFSQADASTTRKHGGTGLGLAISRRILELLGGTIGFESEEGKGTHFWFEAVLGEVTLMPETPAVEEAAASLPIGGPLRILVAEDNVVNQQVIVGLLQMRGIEADVVGDGREALEAVQSRSYNLVFMDVQMPHMDGLAATRAIRSLHTTAALTPIIALTANARREDEAQCLAAGMNLHLAKPIRKDVLFAAMDQLAGHQTRPQAMTRTA
ncbi:MAG: response regulator [Alphaproteobacteria bacterium]|nr:response regulator [Alphaproteobacteria bacterium]